MIRLIKLSPVAAETFAEKLKGHGVLFKKYSGTRFLFPNTVSKSMKDGVISRTLGDVTARYGNSHVLEDFYA